MTGFEPATTRPPGVYATGLRYIPIKIPNSKYQAEKHCKSKMDFKFGLQK